MRRRSHQRRPSLKGEALSALDEQKPSRRLWVFAAVTALVLHAGGAALAIAHLQTDEPDESLGANAIEVGLELASVRREATDLPAGPDTDASAASPQLAEQKAEVKETDLPQDKPTEVDEADRVVTPNESKKPKEDDPKVAAVQTQASTESVAAEATATPSSDAIPEGPRSIAPAIGTGETARRIRATWQKDWSPISTSTSGTPRNASKRPLKSTSASRSTGSAMCWRRRLKRVRVIPSSTKRRWRWCGDPIRCLRRRRWSPTMA